MGQKEILLFQWDSIGKDDIKTSFERMGYTCDTVHAGSPDEARSEKFEAIVDTLLTKQDYCFVFSTNFFFHVAIACHNHATPYISWSYDSPTRLGDDEYVRYDTNYIFMFDSLEVKNCRERNGYTNVYYMPLGFNKERYERLLGTKNVTHTYASDISFVGRMYDSKIYDAMQYLDDYKRGFLQGVIDASFETGECEHIYNMSNEYLIDWIDSAEFNEVINSEFEAKPTKEMLPYRLGILLSKSVTNKKRLLLLGMLSNHFNLSLYSDKGHSSLKNVRMMGMVDYDTEMPFVFRDSKINLNITYLSIRAGIPLRCIDIVGCHGLLLTNHQKDLDEYFEDGKNILLYDSPEEAYDKCKFYLTHESERKRIEDAGYETAACNFDYMILLRKILGIAGIK